MKYKSSIAFKSKKKKFTAVIGKQQSTRQHKRRRKKDTGELRLFQVVIPPVSPDSPINF